MVLALRHKGTGNISHLRFLSNVVVENALSDAGPAPKVCAWRGTKGSSAASAQPCPKPWMSLALDVGSLHLRDGRGPDEYTPLTLTSEPETSEGSRGSKAGQDLTLR